MFSPESPRAHRIGGVIDPVAPMSGAAGDIDDATLAHLSEMSDRGATNIGRRLDIHGQCGGPTLAPIFSIQWRRQINARITRRPRN